MKAKTVRDAVSHTYSEVSLHVSIQKQLVRVWHFLQNLYAMSELAQELIKSRTQTNSWSLQSYPGKVKLPSDILRALPSPDAANKVCRDILVPCHKLIRLLQILKTVYLPEQTLSWLAELKTKAGSAVKVWSTDFI